MLDHGARLAARFEASARFADVPPGEDANHLVRGSIERGTGAFGIPRATTSGRSHPHRHARVPHDPREGAHDGIDRDRTVGAEAALQELASHQRVVLTDHDHAEARLVREECQRLELVGRPRDPGVFPAANQDQGFGGSAHGALQRPQARGRTELHASHHAHVAGRCRRAPMQRLEGCTVHVVEGTTDPEQVAVATARFAQPLASALRVSSGQRRGGLDRSECRVGSVTAAVIGKEADEDVQGCGGDGPRRGSSVVHGQRIGMLEVMSTGARPRWPGLRIA
jgi:hypothetical protein